MSSFAGIAHMPYEAWLFKKEGGVKALFTLDQKKKAPPRLHDGANFESSRALADDRGKGL